MPPRKAAAAMLRHKTSWPAEIARVVRHQNHVAGQRKFDDLPILEPGPADMSAR
jgi:hypothetical protein